MNHKHLSILYEVSEFKNRLNLYDKIKFTNEKKMQNFEQKIIEVYFDCVIIDEIHIIRTSDNHS